MLNQKGISPITVISGILILAGVVYLLSLSLEFNQDLKLQQQNNNYIQNFQKKEEPSPSPRTVDYPLILSLILQKGTTPYTNSNIDISFQYPTDFNKLEVDTQKENQTFRQQYPEMKNDVYGDFFVSFYAPHISEAAMNQPNFDYQTYSKNAMSISVQAYANPNNLKVQDYIKANFTSPGVDGKTPGSALILPALKKVSHPNNDSFVYEGLGGGEQPHKIIYFTYKGKFYSLSLQGGTDTGDNYSSDAEKIFDNLVESIKLL